MTFKKVTVMRNDRCEETGKIRIQDCTVNYPGQEVQRESTDRFV